MKRMSFRLSLRDNGVSSAGGLLRPLGFLSGHDLFKLLVALYLMSKIKKGACLYKLPKKIGFPRNCSFPAHSKCADSCKMSKTPHNPTKASLD